MARIVPRVVLAFITGFLEGHDALFGRTYENPDLNEAYDWGRALRRRSRVN